MSPSAPSVKIDNVPSSAFPHLHHHCRRSYSRSQNHSGNVDGGAIDVCLSILCHQRRALIWATEVEGNYGSRLGTFDLFEGVELANQDQKLCIRNGLSEGYRKATLSESCEVAECARSKPLIWRKWVNVSSREVELEVKDGEDLADAIFQALKLIGVPLPERRKVMDAEKSNSGPQTR